MDIDLPIQKHKWIKPTSIIVLLLSVIVSIHYWIYLRVPAVSLNSVNVYTVQQGDLEVFIPTHGTFNSAHESLLTSGASGVVREVLLKPGQTVNAGDVIAVLENKELNKQKDIHNNDYLNQQAEVGALKLRHQQQLLDADADLLAIEANIAQAELDVNIHGRLQKLGVSSKIELEKAQLQLALQSRNRALHIQKLEHMKSLQQFQVKQANLQLTQALLTLNQTEHEELSLTIKAQQSGTLQNLKLELGQRVDKGMVIAKIAGRDELLATFNIPAHKINDIKNGTLAYISIGDRTFKTHLQRIESEINRSSIVAESVKIDSSIVKQFKLRPTQSFTAKIYSQTLKNKTFVKRSIGIETQNTTAVYKRQNNQFELTKITTNGLTDSAILISSGVEAGDQIIGTLPDDFTFLAHYKKFTLLRENKEHSDVAYKYN